MTVYGQDWASYQGGSPSTSDVDFVFIKGTQGVSYVSPEMASQAAKARKDGKVVGFYHFLETGNIQAQAEHFVTRSASVDGDMLACDWETDPATRRAATCAEKDAFIHAVKKLRPTHRTGLYCNLDFWKTRDTDSYCGDYLWIADPNASTGHPRIQHAWTFHQYSEAGGVDRDVANFSTKTALQAWTHMAIATKPSVGYEPFPGESWFKLGRKSPIVAAMHKRLVASGCNHYQSSANADVIGTGDVASYEAWQRKCGFTGAAAKWPPGTTTWNKLHVPNV